MKKWLMLLLICTSQITSAQTTNNTNKSCPQNYYCVYATIDDSKGYMAQWITFRLTLKNGEIKEYDDSMNYQPGQEFILFAIPTDQNYTTFSGGFNAQGTNCYVSNFQLKPGQLKWKVTAIDDHLYCLEIRENSHAN